MTDQLQIHKYKSGEFMHFQDYKVSNSKSHTDSETILRENGYIKSKHLCSTLKGEILIANDWNRNSEPVCIKKISISNKNKNIDSESVKNTLLSMPERGLEYIDFFQSKENFYFVTAMNFGMNLKQFVQQCQKYIQCGKLEFRNYRSKIRELLWRLTLTVHNLHQQHVVGLDMCAENIFLSHSDFIQNGDGSVMINPEIDIKLIDFSNITRDMNEEKEKTPNTEQLQIAQDMEYFGNIFYFCLVFKPLPKEMMVHNISIKTYLAMHGLLRLVVPKSVSLLQNLLNNNKEMRFKTVMQVIKHKYFRRFYNINYINI